MALLAAALSIGTLGAAPAGATVTHNQPRVSTGLFHSCVALPAGAVKCWGLNLNGDLGSGSNTHLYRRPVDVVQVKGALAVASGDYHSCVLIKGGTVKCWGVNAEGEVGNGTTKIEKTPIPVAGLTGITQIAAAGNHTCALANTGIVKCWGENTDGVLGSGTDATLKKPLQVVGLRGVRSITTSATDACALLKNATVKCWGENAHGQLGNGTDHGPAFCALGSASYACSRTPVTVHGLTGVTAVAVGATHTCALMKDATVRCWGGNHNGELGNGTTNLALKPKTVTGLKAVAGISAAGRAGDSTCALLKKGTVECWGYNHEGQLGNGTTRGTPHGPSP